MLQIIDTHQHLWYTSNLSYPWLDDFDALDKRYTSDDYRRATAGLNVVRSVHVEADPAPEHVVEEVKWLTQIAEQGGIIGAIVAAAPLEVPNVEDILKQLTEYALVVGIRRMAWHRPDAEFYREPNLIQGVQLLERFNLSFDLCANHEQLPAAIALVKATPNVRHAVNHCGGPDIKGKQFQPWADHMSELAAFNNVHCKVSGIVTTASNNWTKEELKPYIDRLVTAFGYDRLMFGSDWPVCTLAAEYKQWLDALLWAVQDASDADKQKLFHDNAKEFYRIDA
ncbi:MAG: amidohydrolase family protein [Candidatus Poribacteria bacterium]|nr:amidohydrolase family protein [Candidatus Poribacteria bacterium]